MPFQPSYDGDDSFEIHEKYVQGPSQGSFDMDSQDKARGLRAALRPRMGAGRNIGGGPGGEAPGRKRVLGDLIFIHLQKLNYYFTQ